MERKQTMQSSTVLDEMYHAVDKKHTCFERWYLFNFKFTLAPYAAAVSSLRLEMAAKQQVFVTQFLRKKKNVVSIR